MVIAADLEGAGTRRHHGARASWVDLMLLAAGCRTDSAAGLDIGTGVGLAEPRQERHDRGVEGKLGPMPEGEAARDNLAAPATGTLTFMSASRMLRAALVPTSEPQAAQKDAKQRHGNGDVVPRWRDVENAGGEGPTQPGTAAAHEMPV